MTETTESREVSQPEQATPVAPDASDSAGASGADRSSEELEAFLADAPLFFQPWWLEAVAPGKWDFVVVRRGPHIAAVMPYVLRSTGWMGNQNALIMPPETRCLGPWLRPSRAKLAKKHTVEKELMLELIDGLPPHVQFGQYFHYTVSNWMPFFWRGYQQTTRYTYVLEDLTDPDAIWKDFDADIRWNIRRARRYVEVVEDYEFEEFMDTRDKSFHRQGILPGYSREIHRKIHEACQARDACKMYVAVDAKDNVHAVAYIIWNAYSAHYILGGGDPTLRSSGANCLLLWEAIQQARKVTRRFDFDGSMHPPIEKFFRLFGAQQKPYHLVTKDSRLFLYRSWQNVQRLGYQTVASIRVMKNRRRNSSD